MICFSREIRFFELKELFFVNWDFPNFQPSSGDGFIVFKSSPIQLKKKCTLQVYIYITARLSYWDSVPKKAFSFSLLSFRWVSAANVSGVAPASQSLISSDKTIQQDLKTFFGNATILTGQIDR